MIRVQNVFPHRYTQEQLEAFLKRLNESTVSALRNTKEVDTEFVELPDGTKYALKTVWGPKIYNLNELEKECAEFVRGINEQLRPYDLVYIRKPWIIYYVNPTHLDPHTFDYLLKPRRGYWILNGRFRGINYEDK